MGDVDEDKDNAASGDVEVEKPEVIPPPEPEPKPPDVELFVDGFGFMPKPKTGDRRRSSLFAKLRSTHKDAVAGEAHGEQSPCASSTNIDIVRRYTWKTKNRMTVQVELYSIQCQILVTDSSAAL